MTDTGNHNHNDNDATPAPIFTVEQELVRALSAGEEADLGGARLDAHFLRGLIAGQNPDCVITPFGVRIRNAEIVGRLDFEGVDLTCPLALASVTMNTGGQDGSILIRDARIRRLNLSNCTLAGGIVADRAQIETGIIIAGCRIGGPLLVRGVKVGGALSIQGAQFGDGNIAMLATGASVSGPLVLRRASAQGELRLQHTYLEAGVQADELRVIGDGAGIYCDAARIGGDVELNSAQISGPVNFDNATINGGFTAPNLVVEAPVEGVAATGLEIGQSLDLNGARIIGPLILEGASITKSFLAEGIEVDGGEVAIAADMINIGGNWEMPRARLVGQVRCPGAGIGGQLRCTSIRIYGSDLAIRADGARINGGVFFSRAVISGAVRFPAAEVHNRFRFSGATIKVDEGAALLGSGAVLRRDAELNAGFQTIGGVVFGQAQIHGNCDLTTSHIKSAAIVRNATIAVSDQSKRLPNDDTALSFVDANVDRLEFPSRADERPRGIVDLSRAQVGAYVDWAATWPPPANENGTADHLVLDGFRYEQLENPAGVPVARERARGIRERVGKRRITWLLGQSAADTGRLFKPQAWVYLSKQLTTQGLDRDARLITIERRRRERRSRWSTSSARWKSRFLDWFTLYGFNPWRTVAWMAACIILFAGIWSWSAAECTKPGCFDERIFVTSKRDAFSPESFASRYPAFHPLAYSFDVFVPFVSFGYEDHWRPNMSYAPLTTWRLPHIPAFVSGETAKDRIFADVTITTGGVLYVLVILEKILGLILTSLMVTGFAGLLREHE